MDRPRRIAFLNTHPIQYFAPLYAYLNAANDLSVTALYLSDYSIRGGADRAFGREVKWDIDLLAGYDARFIDGAARRGEPQGFFSMLAPALWGEVRAGRFDALIVHGHTPAAVLLAVAAARASGTPVFTRGETHLGLARSGLKSALRRPIMGAYYSRLAGALAIGSANRAFYRAMGVPERRIFSAPYTVDNTRFSQAARLSADERRQGRAALGVDDDRPIVLFAAKFTPRKRPDDLIRAAALLRQGGEHFHLAMVGSGEMEAQLRRDASEHGLDVSFPGFVNQAALPSVYAASDVFVLPSDNEPWGLAVNEAMCAGLPVVLSEEIGCVPDLVRDGVNGAVFRAGDVAALADALRPIIRDPARRRCMGAASREIIAHWSYAECLDGLRAALASVGR
ncbi:MAG TPA: glycosyltransferase family 4 protein [Caulobacteraceae bacterium]|jgi:glycosyltransferase involved in cell wall biosynthesis